MNYPVRALALLAAGVGLLCVGTSSAAQASGASTMLPATNVEIATFDSARLAGLLLKETNRVRKENQQRALRIRPEIKSAAESQASYMALSLRPTHVNELSRSSSARDRVKQAGLETGSVAESVQMLILESLTYEQTAAALVKVWMTMPDDRSNLLSSAADYLGCAVSVGRLPTGEEAAFAVEVFYRADRPVDSGTSTVIRPAPITAARRGAL